MRSYLAAAVSALILLIATHAHAGGITSFRCPDTDRLIEVGMSPYEVSSLCRAPDSASTHTETVSESTTRWEKHLPIVTVVTRTVQHDDWTFDFGHSRFVRYLGFIDGRLCQIAEGPYGTND